MKKKVRPIDNFEVYIGTVCTIIMVIIMFLNVVGRYVLKTSIKWAEEVELILFIQAIYFGACGAIRTRQHLRLEIVTSNLKPKARMILDIIDDIIFMAFNIIILWGIIPLVIQLKERGTTAAVTGFPKWISYVMLPILFVLMLIRLVQDIRQRYLDWVDDPDDAKRLAAQEAAMRAQLHENGPES